MQSNQERDNTVKNIKRVVARFGFTAAMLTVLGASMVAPVAADGSIGANGTLSGSFSTGTVTGSTSFTGTLNGTAQDLTGTGTPVINVSDFTAGATGWSVTASATRFANAGATKTLAADALSVTGVTPSDHTGTQHTTATSNSASYTTPIALGATAVTIFNTGAGSGTGNFDLAPAFSLHVAATDKADSYSSLVTISVIEG